MWEINPAKLGKIASQKHESEWIGEIGEIGTEPFIGRRAGLVKQAGDYPWSSAAFHLGTRRDALITRGGHWGAAVDGWRSELESEQDGQVVDLLRHRAQSGFPCGDEEFVEKLSQSLGRPLILRGRGRPRKN